MIRYAVPKQCVFCGAAGGVALEARVRDGAVALSWCCQECHREWPVGHEELLAERRLGLCDRRRSTRMDRRRSRG
jgi:hypothetical protein